MRTKLYPCPWSRPKITDELIEATEILSDNVWRESSVEFYAVRDAKIRFGERAPKGMQKYINEVIHNKFLEKGWEGDTGYYFKNKTWIRITFRHQMSLGSDIIDAIKVCKKEGMELAVILAANRKTLKIVSPNDASAIVSFEKLQREIINLDGAIDIPLIIGELTKLTSASKEVNNGLLKERPRDISVPADKVK